MGVGGREFSPSQYGSRALLKAIALFRVYPLRMEISRTGILVFDERPSTFCIALGYLVVVISFAWNIIT